MGVPLLPLDRMTPLLTTENVALADVNSSLNIALMVLLSDPSAISSLPLTIPLPQKNIQFAVRLTPPTIVVTGLPLVSTSTSPLRVLVET